MTNEPTYPPAHRVLQEIYRRHLLRTTVKELEAVEEEAAFLLEISEHQILQISSHPLHPPRNRAKGRYWDAAEPPIAPARAAFSMKISVLIISFNY